MKKAFTLIELLVVIAIIAILAAILFPVFAQAKEAAKKTQALSNMKQLGLGLVMYANDYDDFYPRCQNENFTSGANFTENWEWSSDIYPYIKNGISNPGNSGSYAGVTQGGQGSIYSDPDFKPAGQFNQFGVHGDMMPECMYWDAATPAGCASTRSETILSAPASTIGICLKGSNGTGSGSSFTQIDTNGYDWLAPAEATAYKAAGQTGNTPDSWAIADGDCDFSTFASWTYAYCASLPRFLHNNNGGTSVNETGLTQGAATNIPQKDTSGSTVASFFDGHAKALTKGTINWGTNFHVVGVDDL